MDKEKLILQIMKEAEADGEPLTREEAEEVAEMEIKAKGVKNYVQSDIREKEKRKAPNRKPDEDKRTLIQLLFDELKAYEDIDNLSITKIEKEIDFEYYGNKYTLNLVKHRPPK